MMTIGNVSHNSRPQFLGVNKQMENDPVGRNIQNQIENKKKELQNLSKLEDMSPEEKFKKAQEIQKEIADLQNQLHQHQIEQRMKQQQKSLSNDMLGGSKNQATKKQNNADISQSSMRVLISADSSIKQSKVQGSVATKMKGKARVLEAEIKQDKGRGASTERKEAELTETQDKIQNTVSSQMSTLSNAVEETREAAKVEQAAGKDTEKKINMSEKSNVLGHNSSKNGTESDRDQSTEGMSISDDIAGTEKILNTHHTVNYTPVDILI